MVTGASGQDGSYLCELLLSRGYEVSGLVREATVHRLVAGVTPLVGDLADADALRDTVAAVAPDEVYHLAAQTFVGGSWDGAVATAEVTGLGALRLLDAVRREAPDARWFQASSAEVFGRPAVAPQDEATPLAPVSAYGVAKAFAHQATVAHRLAHDAFAVVGVLYNHESPRRPETFVTRKITSGVARISLGLASTLTLGSLDARRDWGFAGDYVLAMAAALEAPEPADYVIATGVTRSIAELLEVAFGCVGIADWRPYVVTDPAFVRPVEPGRLVGDASRARELLGWRPTVTFERMIADMVAADLARLRPQVRGY